MTGMTMSVMWWPKAELHIAPRIERQRRGEGWWLKWLKLRVHGEWY